MFGTGLAIIVAFLVNLPLGRWRTQCQKFSLAWFLAVHLSIPLIVWLRFYYELGALLIPFTVASAVLGQKAGAYKVMVVTKKRRIML